MLAWTLVVAVALTGALEARVNRVAKSANTYSAAHREMKETGRPLLVLVGADWCPGCQVMKSRLNQHGIREFLSNKVAFAQVDKDVEGRLAQRLMRGDRIPQLVLFRKTREGWKATRMVGAQGESTIQSFVEAGLQEAVEPEVAVGQVDPKVEATTDTAHVEGAKIVTE